MRASRELGNQPAQLLGLLLQHMENLTKSRNWTSPSENRQNGNTKKGKQDQTRGQELGAGLSRGHQDPSLLFLKAAG